MTDNVVKTKLVVDDNGSLRVLIKQASKLKKELESAREAMGGVRTPSPVAAARAATQAEAGRQSGLARSVGNNSGTGASARDFAKQTEGLGGLVRLYATFAANIFAAATAFNALSKAVDTANMVKGLDQLGAATGRNLGALSKLLVQTTDGAVSLREAVTAVAQASSGGLSNSNILKLGSVAQKASQALGIDMANALSRLSRGITKLEPELLDEIGIFVRVDKAAQDYARSVGKTVSSLTDFERRQAFANAVLEQGAEKFGKIELEVNPYTKILANLQNLATDSLNVINTALGPLLSILSSSPTALGVAVAGLSAILLKQAVPAIGQYRQGLAKASKEASEFSALTNKMRKNKQWSLGDEEVEALNKNIEVAKAKAEKDVASLTAMASARSSALLKPTKEILAAGDSSISLNAKQIDDLERRASKIRAEIERNGEKMSSRVLAARKLEADSIERAVASSKLRNEQEAIFEKRLYTTQGLLEKKLSYEAALERKAARAASRAQRLNILDDISNEMGARGVRGSITELNRRIDEARKGQDEFTKSLGYGAKTMGTVNAAMTRTIGVAQILGSAFGTIVGSGLHMVAVIGAIVAAGALVLSFFSRAGKESERFSSAVEVLDASLENADKTLIAISKKSDTKFLSVESIQARATAMQGLADAAEDVVIRIESKLASMNWADKIFDVFKWFSGSDSDSLLEKSILGQVQNTIKLIEDPALKKQATEAFIKLFDVDVTNTKRFKDALDNLNTQELVRAFKLVNTESKRFSLEANNAASSLTGLTTGLGETTKLVNDLYTSLKPTDIQSKLGGDLVSRSLEISKALGNTAREIEALNAIASNPKILALLPPETAMRLAKASAGIKEIRDELNSTRKEAEAAEAAYASAVREFERAKGTQKYGINKEMEAAIADLQHSEAKAKAARIAVSAAEARASAAAGELAKVGDQLFAAGVNRMALGLKAAMAEAGAIAANSYISAIKSAGGNTADLEYKLKLQEIDQQKNLIDAQYAVLEQEVALELAIRQGNAELALARIERNKDLPDQDKFEASAPLLKEIEQIKLLQNALKSSSRDLIRGVGGAGNNSEAIKLLAKEFKPLFEVLFGREGQLAKLGAQSRAAEVTRDIGRVGEARKDAKAANDRTEAANTRQLELLSALGIKYDKTIEARRESLEIANAEIAASNALGDATEKQAIALIALRAAKESGDKAAIRSAEDAYDETERNRQEVMARNSANLAKLQLKFISERAAAERDLSSQTISNMNEVANTQAQVSNKAVANAREELDFKRQQGLITEQNYAGEVLSIQAREIAAASAEKIVNLENQKAQIESVYAERLKKATKAGEDRVALEQYATSERQKALDLVQKQIDAENQLSVLAYLGVSAGAQRAIQIADQNDKLADQTRLMDILTNSAELLGSSFGQAASSIVLVVKALQENSQKQEAINNKLAKDKEKYRDDEGKYRKAVAKAEYEQRDTQLETYSKIAAAGKAMFKEKTFAHKAFAAVEKAIHVMRLANNAAEIASDLKATISAVTQSGTRSVAKGIEAVISSLTLPPPFGWIAAGITAAIVASLIGKSVGGKASMPQGFDAESQQKVQGTGQAYVNGELVNRGGGALGDPTAKANSLSTSLEKIEEHTFDTLEYSNDMLNALRGIERNTSNLGAILLQAGLNLKNVNPDGTVQGLGTTYEEVAAAPKNIFNLGAATFGDNSGLGKINNKLYNAVFGGKTTKELLNNGIQAIGTLGELIAGGGDISEFMKIKTTKKGGLFSSDDVSYDTETKALEGIGRETISEIFRGISDTVVSAAKELGKDADTIKALTDSFESTFEVSLKGLSPEEVVEALTNEFSVQFNKLSENILPEFQKFRKPAEEFGNTVVRLARDTQLVNLAMESAGLTLNTLKGSFSEVGVANTQLVQDLLDATGGLDAFLDKTAFFADNFLSEAERLAPVQARVTKEMERLGLASIDTREEFAAAVKEASALGPAGFELFNALMNVAKGFAEVYPELENAGNILKDLKKANKELLDEYDKLTMSNTDYTEKLIARYSEEEKAYYRANKAIEDAISSIQKRNNLENTAAAVQLKYARLLKDLSEETRLVSLAREKELSTLSPINSALQRLIWAREDEIAAIEKEKTAVNNLKSATAAITQGFIAAADGLKNATANVASVKDNLRSQANTAASSISSILDTSRSNLDTAKDGTKTARENISNKLFEAQDRLSELLKEQADAASDVASSLYDLGKSIKEFVENLATSELGGRSEPQRLKVLERLFDEQSTKAKAGDADALGSITQTSSEYLELAKSQSKTQLDFAKISARVQNTLYDIGVSKTVGGPPSSSGSQDISAKIAEAQASVASLLKIAEESGADTVRTTEDLLAEYKKAREEENTKYTEYMLLLDESKGISEKVQSDVEKIKEAVSIFESIKAALGADFVGPVQSVVEPLTEALNAEKIAKTVYEAYSAAVTSLGLEQAIIDAKQETITQREKVDTLVTDYRDAKAALIVAQETLNSTIAATGVYLGNVLSTPLDNIASAIYSVSSIVSSSVASLDRNSSASSAFVGPLPTNEDKYYKTVDEITGYADGGTFSGGLRLVGERGPEIEVTGPSRIFSTQQTQNMLGTNELLAEISLLRQEVAMLRYSSEKTENHTKKTKDMLTRVTRDGDSIITQAA